jgi:hypothetical protein
MANRAQEMPLPLFAAQTGSDDARAALEADWLTLTRNTLPAIAAQRCVSDKASLDKPWPVRNDHCFMRILLDAAYGRRWDDVLASRPAYRHIDTGRLTKAIALGKAVAAGEADIWALNRQSLAWRGKYLG